MGRLKVGKTAGRYTLSDHWKAWETFNSGYRHDLTEPFWSQGRGAGLLADPTMIASIVYYVGHLTWDAATRARIQAWLGMQAHDRSSRVIG